MWFYVSSMDVTAFSARKNCLGQGQGKEWCDDVISKEVVLISLSRGGGGDEFEFCQGSTRCRVQCGGLVRYLLRPIRGRGSLVVQSSPPKLARPESQSVSTL